ncbi:MAG: hypothetical protein EAZ99_12195 [Alphaproteobacteria bacterium]|nr:MAG: hypothetical protein EAZ99_12195 [Alphaproteobacteria bacterium]
MSEDLAEARRLAANGMADGALARFDRHLRDHADDAIAVEERRRLLIAVLHRAVREHAAGRLHSARLDLDWLLEHEPDLPNLAAAAGSLATAEARFLDAQTLFARCDLAASADVGLLANAGQTALACGDGEQAVALLQRAVALAPTLVPVRLLLAAALVASGRWVEGFEEFEARLDSAGYAHALKPATPVWDGTPRAGQRLVLLAQQGFGDAIQMLRYLPLLTSAGMIVSVAAAPPLHRLIAPLADVSGLDALPPHDVWLDIMSLPHRFATTPETVPPAPYLSVAEREVAPWRDRLAHLPGRRVGLVWAGSSHGGSPLLAALDRRRSLPTAALSRLPQEGISWVALQPDRPVPRGAPIHPVPGPVRDFADTAALMMALDAIVSVDTAAIHVAGALGRPAVLLNRFDSCWRWGLRGTTTPWYASVTIRRQERPGEWGVGLLGDV